MISTAFTKLENSVTPEQIQNLLNTNSLYKVYTSLKVSEPLLLRYINKYNLSFSKAFRTLRDLSDNTKNQILQDWKTTCLTKRKLREKYNIGSKTLNQLLKINKVEHRTKVQPNPDFVAYQKLVRSLTQVMMRHYKLETIPGYEWDHKFSVYEGFHQAINPSIIASRENLELIPTAKNRSNGRECSITRDELLLDICYSSL